MERAIYSILLILNEFTCLVIVAIRIWYEFEESLKMENFLIINNIEKNI